MDDAKIKQLTEEVLSQIRGSGPAEPSDLEGRVAALEAAVRAFQAGRAAPAASATILVAQIHPALSLLGPAAGGAGKPCVLEPDKPCVGSGQCRSFGH